MTAVECRTYIAVELAVVHIGKRCLELLRLILKPLAEAVPYLVDLAAGQLDSLTVSDLDVIAVFIDSDALHHIRHRIVQGVNKKMHSVVCLVISSHTELVTYLCCVASSVCGKFINILYISDCDVCLVEFCHIPGIYV